MATDSIGGFVFDFLSMNSFLFDKLSIGCEIFKIIKQHPNGSKAVHYLRLTSHMRSLLGSVRTNYL